MSLWTSVTDDSYLQCFSATHHTDPTSGLHDMPFRGTGVRGYRISRGVSRIRCKTSLVLHLEDTHSDHSSDFLAFSLIVYLVVRSNVNNVPIPRLLRIIARDATYYFMVIFTSHLVFVLFLAFASVRIASQCPIISLLLT